jgi:hypothetical protein
VAVVLLFIHPFLELQLAMFDRLFTLPAIRFRHCSGPLVQERLAYLTHLADQGMGDRCWESRLISSWSLVICVWPGAMAKPSLLMKLNVQPLVGQDDDPLATIAPGASR